jgi:GNAT superfamily N-acetyltransferase
MHAVDVNITDYFPGAIGKITELHAVYYFRYWGFDLSFEAQVARELSEFLVRFDEQSDFFQTAFSRDRFAGAIAIDGQQEEGARLRWFIVDPTYQGQKIGDLLIRNAVDFCKTANHKKIFLWTFQGLDAARKLYEKHGLHLTEEHSVHQWGQVINEQKFEMSL